MFTASAAARRIAISVAVLAGASVVALSWTVPEPTAGESRPAERIEPIAYERCVRQAPVSYGTRSLSNPVAPGC